MPDRTEAGFSREHLRSLGRRLRALREARSWSLKRLAAQSGISVAAIQKIEAGEANPSLVTVLAIAEALGEQVDKLVAASRSASRVVNVARGTLPTRPTDGVVPLAGALHRPRVKSWLVALPGRGTLRRSDIPKKGPLFAYVLSGGLELRFRAGPPENLATGDSIHVSEELPTEWANPLGRRSLVLCIADRRGEADEFDGHRIR